MLANFAAANGVALIYDTRLTEGLSSPGLHGQYGLYEGFSHLLSGTGLELVGSGNNFQLHRRAALTLEDTQVQGASANLGATTEHSGSYTTGSMGVATRLPLSIRETPQSVSVVTRKRMDDQGMTRLEDALAQVTGVNVMYETADQVRFTLAGLPWTMCRKTVPVLRFKAVCRAWARLKPPATRPTWRSTTTLKYCAVLRA